MYYAIYLVGVALLFFCSATFSGRSIYFVNILYFVDNRTFFSMLFICALALLCTKLVKPFGQAFLVMFGKTALSTNDRERCLLAVKTVASTSVLWGVLLSVMRLINAAHSLEDPANIAIVIGLALLSVFYALLICLLLLPVQMALKKQIPSKK